MTKIEDIEKAVAGLTEVDPAKFRAWFDEFEGARLDSKIERDAKTGKPANCETLREPVLLDCLRKLPTWAAR